MHLGILETIQWQFLALTKTQFSQRGTWQSTKWRTWGWQPYAKDILKNDDSRLQHRILQFLEIYARHL